MAGQKVKPAADLHPAELAAAVFSEHCQSVLDAESRLARFEQTGHGLFIWQAYKSAREASGSEDAARVAMDALGLPDDISARLDAVMTRVLGLLDLIANEMVGMSGVTGAAQAGDLRKALMIEGEASPAKSKSMVINHQIIELFETRVIAVAQQQRIFAGAPPSALQGAKMPRNKKEVYKEIAERVGRSYEHVWGICEAHIAAEMANSAELKLAFPKRGQTGIRAMEKIKGR